MKRILSILGSMSILSGGALVAACSSVSENVISTGYMPTTPIEDTYYRYVYGYQLGNVPDNEEFPLQYVDFSSCKVIPFNTSEDGLKSPLSYLIDGSNQEFIMGWREGFPTKQYANDEYDWYDNFFKYFGAKKEDIPTTLHTAGAFYWICEAPNV